MAGELEAAREIQMGMLPEPDSIEGLPGSLEFYAVLEPAYEVGGDLYDAFMMDERRFFFIVGDVAGKGGAASLFMALSKTLCKSTALRGYVPLDELMGKVNREISRENQAMLFVTAIAGIVDVINGELQLCSAGHDASILLRSGKEPRQLDIDAGPPLCVLEGYQYPGIRVVFQANDLLVLTSDGVAEAHDPAQGLYGKSGIMNRLRSLSHEGLHAEDICRGLYEDVKRFSKGATQSDDITILVVRFRGSGS